MYFLNIKIKNLVFKIEGSSKEEIITELKNFINSKNEKLENIKLISSDIFIIENGQSSEIKNFD